MKKIYLLFTFLCASILGVFAESNEDILAQINLPSCADFVAQNPYPTKTTNLEAWNEDSTSYFKNKIPYYDTLSYEPLQLQLNMQHAWANLNEQYYFCLYRLTADSVMNAPFIQVSWNEENPYIKNDITRTPNNSTFGKINQLEQLCEQMKEENTNARVRPRPFNYFPDQYYNGTKQKYNPNATGSYPSGHGYFRGLFGKCLEIIDPEHNEVIQDMLDEWLHCRLQKGAHWESDLPAGKALGEMAFDSAMTVEAFRSLVFEARKELEEYRGITPKIREGEEFIEAYIANLMEGGEPTNMTINRTLYKDGAFNTLCLPFSLSTDEIATGPLAGCELFEFVSASKDNDVLELNIQRTYAITAGTPYLIKWESGENIYSMTFNNVTITASTGSIVGESGNVQFVGTMGQSELTAGEELFLGANNTLYWPSNSNKLKGFRAYFLVNDNVAPHGAPARIVMRDNSTTGVEAVSANIYCTKHIENGRLYIIKNGVRYNAQGQMIK